MKTSLIAIVVGLAGMVAGLFIGANQYGSLIARNGAGAELKLHLQAYEKTEGSHQLKEYLESRVYDLVWQVDERDLEGLNFDLGPIDESLLNGLSGIKGSASEKEVYESALEIYQRINNGKPSGETDG